MRMLGLIAAASGLFIVIAAEAGDAEKLQDTLVGLEKKAWEAIMKKDVETMKTLVTDDFIEVMGGIRRTRAESLEAYAAPGFQIKGYALDGIKVLTISKDAAILSYQGKIRSVADGQETASSSYVSSVYVKRGGEWRVLLWQSSEDP